ncbi:MAG: MarR family transcriptional regulator [Candidatus Hermodarchaeota archaeon]
MAVGVSNVKKEEINRNVSPLLGMSKSIQIIYSTLVMYGMLKPQQISEKTNLSARTVRYALQRLRAKELVKRVPDLSDLRSHYYQISSIK